MYIPRIADSELRERLSSAGAVVIEGPRACGKTETARQVAASEVLLDVDEQARLAIAIDPTLVLEGESPRLLDEWQLAPELWNHVRRKVDERGRRGQFILTGSAIPPDDVTQHTGAGRFSILQMRPMCLYESGAATGQISLQRLFDEEAATVGEATLDIRRLIELLVIGGWPAQLGAPVQSAASAARDYLDQIVRVDMPRVGGSRRDARNVGRVLRALGRNVATEVSITTLAADAGGADGALDRHTVADYLAELDRMMVTENVPAWSVHLRSRTALRTSEKRHFVDPSLAIAALGGNPERLLRDLNLVGLLFESMVVRDLRVLSQPLGGSIHHYRDAAGREVDVVVEMSDGRWGAFEVKLGTRMVDDGAANLLAFAQGIDTAKSGAPSVLGVITSTGLGYRRPDGIHVIPIGALGP